MAVALVFVDGVGVGERDAARNPFARTGALLGHFVDERPQGALPLGGAWAAVDACLGVEGRPQSPTGQATLYTGCNAAQALGQHLVGFPNQALRALLARESLFLKLSRRGQTALFANAYPRPVLAYLGVAYQGEVARPLEVPRALRRRVQPASGLCAARVAGFVRTLEEAQQGQALTSDLTGEHLGARGREPGLRRTPHEAAAVLLELMAEADFVLFEHFLLDDAGHNQDMASALALIGELDQFLRALAAGLRPGDHLLVVSDHGNVEDLSIRSHTRHAVPLLCFGHRAHEVAQQARSLCDVAPWVLELCP